MNKKLYPMFVNIIITLMLAVITVWIGLYTVCVYDPFLAVCKTDGAYALAALIVSFAILCTFAVLQYNKARLHFVPRKKAFPLPLRSSISFNKLISTIWEVQAEEEKSETLSTEIGWVVNFEDNIPVIVSQREMFYWLVKVNKLQERYKTIGKSRISSPLSQRAHPTIGRRKLRAYRHLLVTASKVELVNTNVLRLQEDYTGDTNNPYTTEKLWNLVLEIGDIVPVTEI